MRKNIMPRVGKNLESLGEYTYNRYETIYISLEGFKKIVSDRKYEIIAVEMNDLFINNFDLSNFVILDHPKYFIFNTEFGIEATGGFSDDLRREELVDKLYIIVPSYEKLITNTINEILTISEASDIWDKEVSTLRRVIKNSKFTEGVDYRKSGNTWLITKSAMERVYGKRD